MSFEVPAGFRQHNEFQRDLCHYLRNTLGMSSNDNLEAINLLSSVPELHNIQAESSPVIDSSSNVQSDPSTSLPQHTSSVQVPVLRCIDKPSSSLPSRLTFTEDSIRANVGFRHIDTLKHHLTNLYQDTIKLDTLPCDAVLDPGDFATLPKSPRNTLPVPRPSSFGEVIHVDIVFGPEVSIGNIHYGLLFVDRFSRVSYIYPLQNLTWDIRRQLDAFFAHLGFLPKHLISDFDTKLIGGKARDHLNCLKIHVNAAPAHRQDKNGLAERHWQTMISMARN